MDLIKEIKKGKIFIYPTDTIYGIGCDATNKKAVDKIRKIKKSLKPFSIIAVSKEWILKNFEVKFKKYIDKLPGRYTFILKSKKKVVADNVSFSDKVGIRIPANDFTKVIQSSGRPFITTSVNVTGTKPIISVKDIPKEIKKKVNIIIDAGVLKNKPSTIYDLTLKKIKKIR